MTKVPVLVTGGAGYIGSHAVLALKDAGWPVCVIDNLVTGFRFAVPEGVPFYEGDIEDAALVARIIAEQGVKAIMHFAGSVVVPESVENPLKYYHNNTVKSRALKFFAMIGVCNRDKRLRALAHIFAIPIRNAILGNKLHAMLAVANIAVNSKECMRGDFVTQFFNFRDKLEVCLDLTHLFTSAKVDSEIDYVLL